MKALRRVIDLRRRFATTVDAHEIRRFEKMTADWWDPVGPSKPLHALNCLRVPFIRDGLIPDAPNALPLAGRRILDAGCGGGILAEPLARLGAHVTGLDASNDMVEAARRHAGSASVEYVATTVEGHVDGHAAAYDAVVASEILEHVVSKEAFLDACVRCLRPGGSLFITTLNKTLRAHLLGIVVAEDILGLLPKGTHDYEKFVEPERLMRILEDLDCRTRLVHGMFYNGLTNTWSWTCDTSINYALHAIKS